MLARRAAAVSLASSLSAKPVTKLAKVRVKSSHSAAAIVPIASIARAVGFTSFKRARAAYVA